MTKAADFKLDFDHAMERLKDYYKTLSISRDADIHQIRNAYGQLAKEYHPEICRDPDAHEKFILINEAYLILSNKRSRSYYDDLFKYLFKSADQPLGEPISDGRKKAFGKFKATQDDAMQKAKNLAKTSLEELLKFSAAATKNDGWQPANAVLFASASILIYQSTDILFVDHPSYAKSIICLLLAVSIFWILVKQKF